MEYGFGTVERALATLHNIADSKRSAFASRLKHLQKLGFPPGVNTGRGRAAPYRPEHVFLLGVILELNQFGFGPEKAVRIVSANLPSLADGVLRAVGRGDNAPQPIICDLPADGLVELTEIADEIRHMNCRTFAEAVKGIEFIGRAGAGARLAMFSISGLVRVLSALIAHEISDDAEDRFADGLRDWADQVALTAPDAQARAEFTRQGASLFERMAFAEGGGLGANDGPEAEKKTRGRS